MAVLVRLTRLGFFWCCWLRELAVSGVRIQDDVAAKQSGREEAQGLSVQAAGESQELAAQSGRESQLSLRTDPAQDAEPQWATTTPGPEYSDGKNPKIVVKLHLSGSIDLTSIEGLSMPNVNAEYTEILSAPGWINTALGLAGGEAFITATLAWTLRDMLFTYNGVLEGYKNMARDMVQDILVNQTGIVAWTVPQSLRAALAQTGTEMAWRSGIFFQKRGNEIAPVLEVNWPSKEVSEQLCDGLAWPGAHTLLLWLPWLIVTAALGCGCCCQPLPRAALLVGTVGLVFSTGPAFGKICHSIEPNPYSWTPLALNLNLVELLEMNVTDFGLPENISVNATFDEDALRVRIGWLDIPKILELGAQMVKDLDMASLDVSGVDIQDFNLDMSFDEYIIDIAPGTFAQIEAEVGMIFTSVLIPETPPPKTCQCLRKVLSFCPYNGWICGFRMKTFFAGSVDVTTLGNMSVSVHEMYTDNVNAPDRVTALLRDNDPRMNSALGQIFDDTTGRMQEKMSMVQSYIRQVLLRIAENPQVYTRSGIPLANEAAITEAVNANVDRATFYFDQQVNRMGDPEVSITVEIPGVTANAVASLCVQASTAKDQLYRALPGAILALWMFFMGYTWSAMAIMVINVVATTEIVAYSTCIAVLPRVMETFPQGIHVVDMPSMEPGNTHYEWGFPSELSFTNRFVESSWILTFSPVPKTCFDKMANTAIMFTGDEDPDLIIQDKLSPEAGKQYVNSEVELLFSRRQVDFTPNSWMAGTGDMVIK